MTKRDFRLNNKKLLLTYPQCDIKPCFFQESFIEKFSVEHPIFYACFASEDHHQTDGKHIHVYVEFQDAIKTTNARFFDIAKYHPNIEVVKSTPYKAVEYVKKDDYYSEYAPQHCPERPFDKMSKSEKNKWLLDNDIIQAVDDGKISLLSLDRLTKNIRIYNELSRQFKQRDVTVKWYFGATGTGKTYTAIHELLAKYGTYWTWNGSFQWFDGYNGEQGVLIDDFRRQDVKFHWMLQLLDKYPLRVPIKGGFVEWKPETIIITCPVDSREAWQWIDKDGETQDWDSYEQLERRISEHKEFTEKYESLPDTASITQSQ